MAYNNGDEFCEGQGFRVMDGKAGCFDFDPTVFGSSVKYGPSVLTIGGFLLCFATILT